MTAIFVNGGGPTYPGAAFSSGTDLLTQLRDNLVTAGWTTVSDTIPTLLVMRGLAFDASPNNHNCWLRFSIPSAGTMRIVGDGLGNGTSLSANYDFSYEDAAGNWFHLTADQDAFCLAVKKSDSTWSNCHAGFVERVEATDRFAWMVGRLDQYYSSAQWARGFKSSSAWQNAIFDYRCQATGAASRYLATGLTTAGDTEAVVVAANGRYNIVPYQTIFDRFCVGLEASYQSTTSAWTTVDVGGIGGTDFARKPYNPSLGRLNSLNSKPFLGTYYYIEDYDCFRGFIRFAAVGLSSLSAGAMTVDPSGKRWLSVGPAGIQGFRIA
jgi:hypothetical protein